MLTARQVVDEWHQRLDACNLGDLMGLIADEVETAAPRRSGQGSAADVRDWVIRSGIRLTPRQIYSRSNAVVVEQAARWPMPDAGAETDGAREQPTGEQTVGTPSSGSRTAGSPVCCALTPSCPPWRSAD